MQWLRHRKEDLKDEELESGAGIGSELGGGIGVIEIGGSLSRATAGEVGMGEIVGW